MARVMHTSDVIDFLAFLDARYTANRSAYSAQSGNNRAPVSFAKKRESANSSHITARSESAAFREDKGKRTNNNRA